jgi:hypothetical protein
LVFTPSAAFFADGSKNVAQVACALAWWQRYLIDAFEMAAAG